MRKLATLCGGFAAAVFICQYLLPVESCLYSAVAALSMAGAAALILKDSMRLRFLLALLGLCAGFLYNGIYIQMVYAPASALDGTTQEITVTAVNFPEKMDYGYRTVVRLDADGVSTVKTTLYVYDKQGNLSDLRPGDTITVTAEIALADSIRGEDTDYYSSRGIFLIAKARSDIQINYCKKVPIRYLPTVMCKAVNNKLAEIYPEKYLGFMQALLTGQRSLINQDQVLKTRLSTVGLSHVIAVSGMHVSFLVGFLSILVRNRRRFAFIAIPFLVLFSMVLGGTPSVVRACFMQIMLLIAPAIRRESDSPTALGAALVLLLILNPFSAENIGLQLSFAATAGIVLISGRLQRKLLNTKVTLFLEKKLPRPKLFKAGTGRNPVLYFICATFSTTIGALALTCPLGALYFGYISLIAPLTNLVCLWAVSAVFVIGLLTVLLGFIWLPLALGVSLIVKILVQFILAVINIFSQIPYAAVYTENDYVLFWLIFLYVTIILWIVLTPQKRPKFTPLVFIACGLMLSLGLGHASAVAPDLSAAFLDVGQGGCSVITGGGSTVVIDCGGDTDSGNTCAKYISSIGKNSIDYLILTHTHNDHVNGVEVLISMVDTTYIVMPEPQAQDDIAARILDVAEKNNVSVMFLTEYQSISSGGIDISLYPPMGSAGENENGLSCVVTSGEFDVLYTGDMNSDSEYRLLSLYSLPDIEVLEVGHHGSKYSSSEDLLETLRPEAAVISVGYNTYGHPTSEAMDRLTGIGADVYRTDLCGKVVIRYSQ